MRKLPLIITLSLSISVYAAENNINDIICRRYYESHNIDPNIRSYNGWLRYYKNNNITISSELKLCLKKDSFNYNKYINYMGKKQ